MLPNNLFLILVSNFHANNNVLRAEHPTGFGDWDKKLVVKFILFYPELDLLINDCCHYSIPMLPL